MTTYVPIKVKLASGAKLPEHANSFAVGADIHALEYTELYGHQRYALRTGVYIEIPPDYEIQVRGKSGLALKHGLQVLNSPGTIDPDYRGEIVVIMLNTSTEMYVVKPGDKIAQLVIAPRFFGGYTEVDELSETERGVNGFGSTGK